MQYRTQQRDKILKFVESTKGRHFTVEELRSHLAEIGETVGIATIYRHIEWLVSEGKIVKFDTAGGASCYQFAESGCAESGHFHLKCEQCGALIHLECDELSQIAGHLLSSHGFQLNPLRTVFHGLCKDCRNPD